MSVVIIATVALLTNSVAALPEGTAPAPVKFCQFPDRLSTFVWRNWPLVPVERMAKVVGAEPSDIIQLGKEMGLPDPTPVSDSQWRRSYITIIKRNWHLLPYEQLLQLLDWTPEHMAFTLREDDFLYIKFGSLKPKCEPIVYTTLNEKAHARLKQIGEVVHQEFASGIDTPKVPLFNFVNELSAPLPEKKKQDADKSADQYRFSPRFCYSYFAVYGDPLLDMADDPFPDGYLARLAASGVDGVWLQAVLNRLAPFPWDSSLSDRYEKRLENLRNWWPRLASTASACTFI